jgi:hypothetical protein
VDFRRSSSHGWSRRFVYYGMGGMGERDSLLMGMGGLVVGGLGTEMVK